MRFMAIVHGSAFIIVGSVLVRSYWYLTMLLLLFSNPYTRRVSILPLSA